MSYKKGLHVQFKIKSTILSILYVKFKKISLNLLNVFFFALQANREFILFKILAWFNFIVIHLRII